MGTKNLSAFDVAYMVRELQSLVKGRLAQVYQPAKKELLLQFHLRGEGRALLKVRIPQAFYIILAKEPAEKVSAFCTLLRKKLNGAVLTAVEQVGFERIVRLDFAGKGAAPYSLFLELFSKGNLILVSEGVIVAVEETQNWSTRRLAVNAPYVRPPLALDPRTLSAQQLLGMMRSTEKSDIVRFFALELGLGGRYAEELCLRCALAKDAHPSAVASPTLAQSALSALGDLLAAPLAPSLVYDESGRFVDGIPGDFLIYRNYQKKPVESYSAALAQLFETKVIKRLHEGEIVRLQTIVSKQGQTIVHAQKSIDENSHAGQAIYGQYQDIKELLAQVIAARKQGGWDAVRQLAKSWKIIKYVDEKKGKLVVDLP